METAVGTVGGLCTMNTAADVAKALKTLGSPVKAKASAWFFKTGPGQYGEGDVFIGVTVPEQRKVAREYKDLPLLEVESLVQSPIHEDRLTGLFILVDQYCQGDLATKKTIASFYHKNRSHVNNWDLVDSSAPYIMGDYLTNHSRTVLTRLAKSKSLWDRRMAVVSTFGWIRQGDPTDAFQIIDLLLNDKEDLIHKACGWMLREVGKNCGRQVLVDYLKPRYKTMPRTTLRYAIEHFSPEERQRYLKGLV